MLCGMVIGMKIKQYLNSGFTIILLAAGLISLPVSAQIDLTGTWASRLHEDWMDRWPGPDPVDFTGLPLNEDGRSRGVNYSASSLSLLERQCLYYPQSYTTIGPFGVKFWREEDPVTSEVIAWKMNGVVDRAPRTIWMDGREHPSDHALRTFAGFSTGEWRGHTLVVTTTHMKAGILRRNGPITSDDAVMTEYITRHDDILTITMYLYDPVYMEAPHVISRGWVLDEEVSLATYGNACIPVDELPGSSHGDVPHYLPGQNPLLTEFSERYSIPLDAALGGAQTLFPEYRDVLRESYVRPEQCGRFCCGWVNDIEGGLMCITE